MKMRSNPYF